MRSETGRTAETRLGSWLWRFRSFVLQSYAGTYSKVSSLFCWHYWYGWFIEEPGFWQESWVSRNALVYSYLSWAVETEDWFEQVLPYRPFFRWFHRWALCMRLPVTHQKVNDDLSNRDKGSARRRDLADENGSKEKRRTRPTKIHNAYHEFHLEALVFTVCSRKISGPSPSSEADRRLRK